MILQEVNAVLLPVLLLSSCFIYYPFNWKHDTIWYSYSMEFYFSFLIVKIK